MDEENLIQMRSEIQNQELLIDNDLKEKFEEITKVLLNEIETAKTFVVCIDLISSLKIIELTEFISQYSKLKSELSKELNDYEDGEGYGDYIIKLRIKDLVYLNKKNIIEFLNMFNKIFITL